MPQNGIYIYILTLLLGISAVYANNTVRVVVPETITTSPNSYEAQNIHIQQNTLRLINRDNDTSIVGDYFTGEYYDAAYGTFSMDALRGQGVRISSTGVSICDNTTTHEGYKLEGRSFNGEFGAMDFNFDSDTYTYICIPKDENSDENSYISGKAFSELIGVQSFSTIFLDVFVDRGEGHESDARYIRVEGVSSSSNTQNIDSEFENEVRILGDITKSSLRRDLLKNVYSSLRNVAINNGARQVTSAGLSQWNNSLGGTLMLQDRVLYFGNLNNQNVELRAADNIQGNKTLIVEGGNIYIRGNLRNIDNDNATLGLMAIEKDGIGGNIYIAPEVTDIHAIMYAGRSILSYVDGAPANGDTPNNKLANQLYIDGSIFSENTIGGSIAPYRCPFYTQETCDESLAKQYDLNHLRRYILTSPVDETGRPTGEKTPNYGGEESYLGDSSRSNTETQKAGYRVYPVVVEYNANLQQSPPPFF